MAKLHQILAVENGARSQAEKDKTGGFIEGLRGFFKRRDNT